MSAQGSSKSTGRRPSLRGAACAELLLNLLFPPKCVACGARGSWLCASCKTRIELFTPPYQSVLDDPSPLQDARAAARLSGPLREAVHSFKYEGLRALASTLGEILYDCWKADPWPAEVIVPVPLHSSRLRERGYNQSALLARELARRASLPVNENTLLRVFYTRPQIELDAAERAENVRNAFRCRDKSLQGLRVLLVDDVLTTGATLRACAQALLKGNVRAVWGLTLARD